MAELAAWESAVRERPSEARIYGPPSWLVLETWNEKRESFQEAAVRVRARYGLDEPQGPRKKANVPTQHKSRDILCENCRDNPREGRYKVCAACRKRHQRG